MRYAFILSLGLFAISSWAQASTTPIEVHVEISHNGPVLKIEGDRAYLNPEYLLFTDNDVFLQANESEWFLIRGLLLDETGYFLTAEGPHCENMHTGFMKRGGIWLCLKEGCEYYFIDYL